MTANGRCGYSNTGATGNGRRQTGSQRQAGAGERPGTYRDGLVGWRRYPQGLLHCAQPLRCAVLGFPGLPSFCLVSAWRVRMIAAGQDAVPSYAELHCISNFTFLRGASHPEELVAHASRLGYTALALTDECSVAGAVRAHVAAREHGINSSSAANFDWRTNSASYCWQQTALLTSNSVP